MIRPFTQADLPQVLEIWLQGNLDAHSFIPASYWLDNRNLVAAQIPQAEVYVFQQQQTIDGFIGLTGGVIAGLFVRRAERRRFAAVALRNTCLRASVCWNLYTAQRAHLFLVSPPDTISGGVPIEFACSAEINSASAKVFAPAKILVRRNAPPRLAGPRARKRCALLIRPA